jgi:TetR/AcrR family transcriptional repressor of nem operon
MSSKKHDIRPRGRPRGFDETTAIEAAMRVFWAQGYAAASIDNLCRAMNVPRASLYQMFGDKEGLFMATIKHYRDVSFAPVMKLLNGGGDLRTDLTAFLNGVIEFATRDPETPGCLIACVLADAAGVNMRFRDDLAFKFDQIEQALADRVARAQRKEDMPSEPSAQDIGMMLAATARGLMVRARTGCKASDMYRAAKAAIDLCLRH